MEREFEFIVTADQTGERIDHFLSTLAELELSRSQVKKLIEDGKILVNKQIPKASYKVKLDDRINISIPPPANLSVIPEPIPLQIVYEDEDIIAVNKPKGMVVHPAPGNHRGTLVNALLHHCNTLSSLGEPLRPGIVHRLDKDTTGIIVAAKNDAAYRSLVKQFKSRTVEKTYLALVHGGVKNNAGSVEARLGRHPVHRKKITVIPSTISGLRSREAITFYKVIERFKGFTLLELKIKTGRTHQIRVHMSYIGHPVVGDVTYGKIKESLPVKGQLLHAFRLVFSHPVSGKRIELETDMPEEMRDLIVKLRSE